LFSVPGGNHVYSALVFKPEVEQNNFLDRIRPDPQVPIILTFATSTIGVNTALAESFLGTISTGDAAPWNG
jgi:hypothetical protein